MLQKPAQMNGKLNKADSQKNANRLTDKGYAESFLQMSQQARLQRKQAQTANRTGIISPALLF